jgi:hypothetical protein
VKNINNKEFTIEKHTMRDLTSHELNQIAGASDCPTHYPDNQGFTFTSLVTNTIA